MVALPQIMGHRGAAGLAPENTLASIRVAAAAGCSWVEFDAMLTGDNAPVLFHDDTLDRVVGKSGRLDRLPLSGLAGLDAGANFDAAFTGEPIPTLEEALRCCLDLGLSPNVEIKPSAGRNLETAVEVLDWIDRTWPIDRPLLVSSFKHDSLAVGLDLAPQIPRGLLTLKLMDDWRALLADLGCVSLHLHDPQWTRSLVTEVKAAGYLTVAFTVNDPLRAATLLGWGLDCVITDQPGLMFEAIQSSKLLAPRPEEAR